MKKKLRIQQYLQDIGAKKWREVTLPEIGKAPRRRQNDKKSSPRHDREM